MIKRPQRVTFFYSDMPTERGVAEAFTMGVEAHGGKCRMAHISSYGDESGPDDWTECAVLYHVKENTRKLWFDHKDSGRRVIHIDEGYLRPGFYFKVSVDDFHPTAETLNIKRRAKPADRWEQMGVELKPRKENLLKHILVVNDHPVYGQFWYRMDMVAWAKKIARRVKGRTSRPVRWYPVGRDWMKESDMETDWAQVCGPSTILDEMLQTAHSVVVFASPVAVRAIVEGLPIFTYGDSVAATLAGNPRFVEAPFFPNDQVRRQWLSNLAYVLWTKQEMWSGECWEKIWA